MTQFTFGTYNLLNGELDDGSDKRPLRQLAGLADVSAGSQTRKSAPGFLPAPRGAGHEYLARAGPLTAGSGAVTGLWPHQELAVKSAVSHLAGGGRCQVIAACGTGKTRIGAEASRQLTAGGKVLVVVPTLVLLAQTARAWAGYLQEAAGVIGAVCSEPATEIGVAEIRPLMDDLHAGVTRDPDELAAWLRAPGRLTVFITYQSLPVPAEAAKRRGVPRWDLIVIDEAHRSAGRIERAWNAVHDDERLPARYRLYMTATPRLIGTDKYEAVGMDDPAVFGPEAYRLTFAEAIEAGLLADYRVAVTAVTEPEVARLVAAGQNVSAGGEAVPARMLAAQIALLKACRQYGLQRVITFHHRVASAQRFAGTLLNAADLLNAAERPRLIRAAAVDGTMTLSQRRDVLRHLDTPGNRTVVVSNARVLTEGVDVPELDAVMFADPRDSATDVVQAVGRALRRGSQDAKTATIIIPVILDQAEAPEAALESPEFATVWRVVRALRAHDERLADWLDEHRVRYTMEEEPTGPPRMHEPPDWLTVSGTPVTSSFARALQVRLVDVAASPWPAWLAALTGYKAEHGNARVPQGYRTPAGQDLGSWLSKQRQQHAAGHLPADRAAALDELGVIWQPQEETWARGLDHATAYHHTHGNLDVPFRHQADDGFPLGSWLAERRSEQRARTLAPDRAAALEQLGVQWDRAFDAAFQRGLDHLAAYRDQHGHTQVPVAWTDPGDEYRLGAWLAAQRSRYRRSVLTSGRVTALEALGVTWHTEDTSFTGGLDHLARYRDQHGHARVPATYTCQDGYQLGSWVARQRARRRRPGRNRNPPLTSDQITALDQLGMIWDATRARGKDPAPA